MTGKILISIFSPGNDGDKEGGSNDNNKGGKGNDGDKRDGDNEK